MILKLNKRDVYKHIAISLLFMVVTILVEQFTEFDKYVSNFFYDFETKSWLYPYNSEGIMKEVLYYKAKDFLVYFGGCLITLFIFSFFSEKIKKQRYNLLAIILSLSITPGVISLLKNTTNKPCPYHVKYYGSYKEDSKIFDTGKNLDSHNRCFPAGHPSGGYALFILAFLGGYFRPKILLVGFTYGSLMAYYQIARGAHYISHVFVTISISYIFALLIYRYLFLKEDDTI